ncbi:MAG TPA: hypothetical protein DHW82_04035 [Spirochaetia bacterium]|nr:MAG: hypothetical protein A2Y41_01765 [Spirochaetes bacterium GWB1_36_13]HCL56162.1 hypothetical protein [Spirochaetia bacterium]
MIKSIIMFGLMLLIAVGFYRCASSVSDDVVVGKKNQEGNYYFIYGGNSERVWYSPSMREGSLSGQYRGGGPNAGK